MTGTGEYRDGVALWSAASAHAKSEAKATGVPSHALLRRFVFDRFLARVFHDPNSPWVLKGGTAVLARVHDARTTKDVDLLHQLNSLDAALVALRLATEVKIDDHFRFVITKVERSLGGGQPAVDGFRVSIDAYCGAQKKDSFGVDLVTGSMMTTAPELRAETVLNLRGLAATQMRLYPVVDHVADKLCATQATYGAEGLLPSSRVRDLVDLVVFARTQDVNGHELIVAIRAEWTHRSLPGEPVFAPPTHWDRLYPPVARSVRACYGLTTFAAAVAFVTAFLSPALDGSAAGQQWSATNGAWRG
ncbi:nucleotidyl transferase AbiEii/AbiGii toxin family protein [Pengzhenrongella frigida]|uniref:Nucleotidyl transferase AbiEii/AbiGii toxin family protein n=1 Tax=Pengzhenrongella frigida TaxID=1259133 RepID=A0A4Q5N1G0_9MICO|nr:nucleotidyl transferase AbiEii/AbiGii toxin family protein [Cellulomonas sp. HLT2-17]RYV51910.1 nucleotidyl transferase AbiEii/AbiGii toxin family protein [Cellulomonas sp. HLT2-17]